jgi:DNA (cytosine-5)-methyltransferase 1
MHLFAGAGGGLLADLILGHAPVVAVEWEPYACRVLRERAADGWFPGLHVWEGDVRLFNPSEYTGSVDCIHAGFPCQDISIAGKQAGVSEGTRSGLYREVLRIAGIVKPRFLFLENVAAIKSNGLDTVLKDLAFLGYDTRWLCIRASDIGANHHRDRWFLLAYTNTAQRSGGGLPGRGSETKPTIGMGSWWKNKPSIYGVDDGVAHRVHRLRAIGNGQVPLQVATAFTILAKELIDAHTI